MVPWSSPEYDVPGNSHCHCQMSGNQKFKFVRSVVDGLDNNARAIIKSIGFGGFLMIPNLSDDNTRFGVWLMSKFDQERNAITVEGKPRCSYPYNWCVIFLASPRKVLMLLDLWAWPI